MIKSITTKKSGTNDAVADIKSQLGGMDVKMLIYFASAANFKPDEISAAMHGAFPGATVFGCMSHAELHVGSTSFNSVTAMAFDGETITGVKVEIIENISNEIKVKPAFASFEKYFGIPMSEADYKEYGGIVLIDSYSRKEEEVMDKIGTQSDIVFIGGSVSDNLKYGPTYIYANGKSYVDAALLAVFKTKKGIDFIKTQSFDVTDKKLVITKADVDRRAVLEFDGVPAVTRYAQLLGVDPSKIEQEFFANPVGLIIDYDIYPRSCQRVDGDAIIFYCSMLEGMDLMLLKARDIVPDTRAAIEAKKKELGHIEGLVEFRCILRMLQLSNEGKLESYAEIFKDIESIGFATYGEQYYGHINQTSTMLVFK